MFRETRLAHVLARSSIEVLQSDVDMSIRAQPS